LITEKRSLALALMDLAPQAEWTMPGYELSALEWLTPNVPRPTNAQILSRAAELFAASKTSPLENWRAHGALADMGLLEAFEKWLDGQAASRRSEWERRAEFPRSGSVLVDGLLGSGQTTQTIVEVYEYGLKL
jgi:hypothetical protein